MSETKKRILVYSLLVLIYLATPYIDPIAPDELLILDFESDADLDNLFWECRHRFERSTERVDQGQWALKATLPMEKYPGVEIRNLPRDWRHFDKLALWVYYDSNKPIQALLRIDDDFHWDDFGRRANINLVLEPGENFIEIPIAEIMNNPRKRKLNLLHIYRMILFLIAPNQPEVLYLDNVRLLRGE